MGELIGGDEILSKKIIYGGFTETELIKNRDYDEMLDIGYYFMHNECSNYPPSNAINHWHLLRVTSFRKNNTDNIMQEAVEFATVPSMWVRYRIDGNFTDWNKAY